VAEGRDAPAPIDIPGFAVVRPGIASGQQPFPDGVTWLKTHGYRTVLHVHVPGEDTSAARRQFERKGLRYLDLAVSPATLSRDLVARFSKLVTAPANRPLFAYDKDSSLLGGLWYLHFRLHKGLSDEQARKEAVRLGFKLDDEEHKTMWLAVQKLLGG
jgi:hypothetical protein